MRRVGYPQFGAEGMAGDAGIADKKLVRRGDYPQFGAEGAAGDVGNGIWG